MRKQFNTDRLPLSRNVELNSADKNAVTPEETTNILERLTLTLITSGYGGRRVLIFVPNNRVGRSGVRSGRVLKRR